MSSKDKSPTSMRIRLKYPDINTFIEKYSANISQGGMFIQSQAPQPVNTPLRFEVVLQDGTSLLRGEGRVIWIKEYDASCPTRVHGMGIRFLRLDKESEAMVERVLVFKNAGLPPTIRPSHTQEVRKLAREAAPAESEEPEELMGGEKGSLRIHQGAKQSVPPVEPQNQPVDFPQGIEPTSNIPANHVRSEEIAALAAALDSPGDGPAVTMAIADGVLNKLMTECAVTENQVAVTLSTILAQPAHLFRYELLDQLMAPISLPSVTVEQVREAEKKDPLATSLNLLDKIDDSSIFEGIPELEEELSADAAEQEFLAKIEKYLAKRNRDQASALEKTSQSSENFFQGESSAHQDENLILSSADYHEEISTEVNIPASSVQGETALSPDKTQGEIRAENGILQSGSELHDEVFEALAGLREDRRDSSGMTPMPSAEKAVKIAEVVVPFKDESIPSLETLAEYTQKSVSLSPQAKPEVKEDDTLLAVPAIVIVEDPHVPAAPKDSSQIQPRKSGILRRIFSKKE